MPKTAKKTGLKEKVLVDYELFQNQLTEDIKVPLQETRQKAIEYFNELGFPHTKIEEWKYTNVRPIIRKEFDQPPAATESSLTQKDIENWLIPDLETHTVVLVNGQYSEKLSTTDQLDDETFVGSFAEGLRQQPGIIKKHFAQYANFQEEGNGFTALNTAFAKDGVLIHLPKGKIIDKPVLILNISDAQKGQFISQPRNLIVTEESSAVEVIEKSHSVGDHYSFNNSVTEIHVGQNAGVKYYKFQHDGPQAYHVGTTEVRQLKDSRFTSYTMSWSGALVRNNLNALHKAENCTTLYYGAYTPSGKELIDNHTLVDHAVPNCYSDELYKGVMDDRSTGVFNGIVYVRPGSQKTNAYQENKNILLTNRATINAKPQLEIFADDVEASHGATSGQLDDNALFYLRSRGLSERQAQSLLLYAFVSDVISKVDSEPIQNFLNQQLSRQILGDEVEI